MDESEKRALHGKLTWIRRQLRNHIAHGAIGKVGEAFDFHSAIGAVPPALPQRRSRSSFRFGSGADLDPDPDQAFEVIARFESHLWSGPRAGIKRYIQDSELSAILTMAADGTYERARASEGRMAKFTERLAWQFNDALNMDW